MVLELDMISKAYDRVEWSFVKILLKKWGFMTNGYIDDRLYDYVSYSILISGEPSDIIRPSRGIR